MRHAILHSLGEPTTSQGGALRERLGRLARCSLVGSILLLGGAGTQARPAQDRALAALPDAPALGAGTDARPVAAWNAFCGRHPGECAVDLAEPTRITLTPAVRSTLDGVNRRVNARIRPLTDMAHWGVVDRWDFPDDGAGDCEDFQLLKRRMLVERGLPRRALRMTVVIDDIGEGHAVLMVRTDRGDLILDNKTNAILSGPRTGYTFIKREGQDGPAWVTLNGGASPVATANR
ncbi:transglutaminase [Methylobacterium sp. Leaf469]|jgi:predicted transglutaminase-like cysteine proteinase|uniref:transglutaminase-like cysteine peptidase n=1 Tax=unclassified Methylobacterium TaxID=2615210 RepID=UPI0006FA5581|nr:MULTISPECIES: transglutaminase-like cysteine peptidase [unclassified Methylobacterium]KQP32582.1 transglutaminase [Methylobacterium sp. Leaf102]KQP67912.1 transglutaminase [Methylobacterium sp. Leaf112]KQU02248.1 transglutaminase [Methylobacterium sp. Leaf469]USU31912.1 transglutaminase-like cysteine peptidase [Methylobacterium sp. OTU13CASTA1]